MQRQKEKIYIETLLRLLRETSWQEVLTQFGENEDVEIENPAGTLLTEEETQLLVKFSNGLQEKGCTCKFEEGYSIPQAIEASRRLNSWVEEIKNARVDGRELTNLEKYVYAYEIVTDFVYNEEQAWEDQMASRDNVKILTGDKIVCSGYASLLKSILVRLDIPCTYVFLTRKDGRSSHAGCAVYLEDEKYGLKNVIFSDPTFGSRSQDSPKDFQYMAMTKWFAEHIWNAYELDLDNVRERLMVDTYWLERTAWDNKMLKTLGRPPTTDERMTIFEPSFSTGAKISKLFENDMKQNEFYMTNCINAIINVFQSQGLSFRAAITITNARLLGKTVKKIVQQDRKVLGPEESQTEQELLAFAKTKKNYSKRETQKKNSLFERKDLTTI